MPAQVTNYKCPSCTGPLHFSASSGKLECEYCGNSYPVEEIGAMLSESEQQAAAAFAAAAEETTVEGEEQWDTSGICSEWGENENGIKVYSCPSCGAELICEETTAATSCPYCGNTTVVPGQLNGALKPDYVIPFKVDKDAAIAALKSHYKGKILLPKAFKSENHIDEIKGVYVPFWLFDGSVDAEVTFHATRVHTITTNKERITTTEHFQLFRSGTVEFEKIPTDASKQMPDDLMDSIEPYDYNELTEFSTAYLPGYLADKYDVTTDECSSRADLRACNSALDSLKATCRGYVTCTPKIKNFKINRGKVKYALMPVWVLNTKWNEKNYLFAMNGQTGKFVGNLPVSKLKFWLLFAGIAVPIAVILALLLLM